MTLPSTNDLATRTTSILAALGAPSPSGAFEARTPITGGSLGPAGDAADVDAAVDRAVAAFAEWRVTPAPVRGNLVRRLGELLREHKAELGELVSIEAGKIRSEGLGEVQEMIDICDFAVGLSRQLHGLTIASERPGHRLMETWHPMGPCAVITAFNFPVAVWSWNAALALVAGDPVIWKPSDKTPLTALACDALARRAAAEVEAPDGLTQVVQGGPDVGAALAAHQGGGHRVGHRIDPHGPGRRTGGRRPLRPPDPRARRQQRGHRRAERRSRAGGARHRVLGRRNGGSALHEPAPAHRPPVDPRRARRALGQGLCVGADRRPAGRRHARSAR